MNETSINSVGDFVDQVISFTRVVQRVGPPRYWYSGQAEPNFSETVLGLCLKESRHLCIESNFSRPSVPHVEWTSDALVALYFAVEDKGSDKRGTVFALDAYAFQLLQRGAECYRPLKKFIIEAGLKGSIKADLAQLGIDHVSVYADLDSNPDLSDARPRY